MVNTIIMLFVMCLITEGSFTPSIYGDFNVKIAVDFYHSSAEIGS